MAVVDTITIGTDTFSVYALVLTEARANTTSYYAGRLGAEATAWAAASDTEKDQAIVMAADWMDRALLYNGTKTVSTQARSWPRDNATNTCTGDTITSGTVPDDMFYTQAALAGNVLVSATAAAETSQGSNIRKVGAGTAQVQFFKPTTGTSLDVRLPQIAHDYSKCYTQGTGGFAAPISSGTNTCSEFSADDFDLTDGFG